MLEPWRKTIPGATVPRPEPPSDVPHAVTSADHIDQATDRIVTARVLTHVAIEVREGRMSLTGRMAHLTERARDFHKKTEGVLEAIEEKINKADTKLNIASEKHHNYYDGIIGGIDESVAVVDRLSNGPLSEDG